MGAYLGYVHQGEPSWYPTSQRDTGLRDEVGPSGFGLCAGIRDGIRILESFVGPAESYRTHWFSNLKSFENSTSLRSNSWTSTSNPSRSELNIRRVSETNSRTSSILIRPLFNLLQPTPEILARRREATRAGSLYFYIFVLCAAQLTESFTQSACQPDSRACGPVLSDSQHPKLQIRREVVHRKYQILINNLVRCSL
jgi:hypothetical protein